MLVSMCGKSVDVPWLCSRGHSVTATELSPIAVGQLFKEHSIPHNINGIHQQSHDNFTCGKIISSK